LVEDENSRSLSSSIVFKGYCKKFSLLSFEYLSERQGALNFVSVELFILVYEISLKG